jgi:hypothetical protein
MGEFILTKLQLHICNMWFLSTLIMMVSIAPGRACK